MLPLLVLLAEPQDPLAVSRALTRAVVSCGERSNPDEITVCARRDADRYRVPLTSIPVRDDVLTERSRLLEPKLSPCGRVGTALSNCGFVGVTMTTSGAGTKLTGRKLAP